MKSCDVSHAACVNTRASVKLCNDALFNPDSVPCRMDRLYPCAYACLSMRPVASILRIWIESASLQLCSNAHAY